MGGISWGLLRRLNSSRERTCPFPTPQIEKGIMLMRQESRLILFTGLGFFGIGLDVYLGHMTAEAGRPFMWIPLFFLPCAVVISLAAWLWPTKFFRDLFCFACLSAVIVGLLGFSFHLLRLWRDAWGIIQWTVLLRLMRYPPLLAPLAISGLGILGLLIEHPPSDIKEHSSKY